MDITVADQFKLTSDGMQIIISRKRMVDPTKSPRFKEGEHDPTPREDYVTWKYAGSVSSALNIILQQKVFESEATTLKQLQHEIASFRHEIKELLGN